mmetsp:Transcript_2813/g.3920  ORF Transcript_2813/g.3920 Transcript_2813/m.3920 type:complete len:109 (+) Transcript_2813:451-777(+)
MIYILPTDGCCNQRYSTSTYRYCIPVNLAKNLRLCMCKWKKDGIATEETFVLTFNLFLFCLRSTKSTTERCKSFFKEKTTSSTNDAFPSQVYFFIFCLTEKIGDSSPS